MFGSILVDNDEANQSIQRTNDKAEKTGSTFSTMIGTVGKWGLAIGAAAATAALAIGVKAVSASDELQKSLNGLQAETGTAQKEMKDMEDTLLNIYKNNFGESFEDIAKVMADIATETGLTGKELESTTRNALMMRDTFEMDVKGSITAVNSLMKDFGITSDEAFELIAQGAQQGLNKNEDLVDVIREYSVHFKNVGLDSEQMFNALKNGAETGAFSMDFLGDAMKEFGIRSKDLSDTSADAFGMLGLDAREYFKEFSKGGIAANEAFGEVTNLLSQIESPLKQNTIGVALFGTKFEDLGADAILALTNTDGAISKTGNALGKINEIKYNTFGEALTGIGRQLEVNLLIPIGDKILPILNKLANWIAEKMPIVEETFGKVLGFVKEKFDELKNGIQGDTFPIFEKLSKEILPRLIEVFKNIHEIYVPKLMDVFNTVFPIIQTIVTNVVSAIVDYVLPPLIAILEFLYVEVMPKVLGVFQRVLPTIEKLWNALWTMLKPLLWLLKETFDLVFPAITKTVMDALNEIEYWINIFLDVIDYVLESIINFKNNWDIVWGALKNYVIGIWDDIKTKISDSIKWITDKIDAVLKTIKSVRDAAKDIGSGIVTKAKALVGIEARETGGSVNSSQPYLVGEKGAELFVPNSNGTIIPNNKLVNGGTTINLTITGNTLLNDRDADKLGSLVVDRLKILGVT